MIFNPLPGNEDILFVDLNLFISSVGENLRPPSFRASGPWITAILGY